MFSHPADFTPVCTTELGRFAQLQAEFDKRGVKLIALSCDGVESHLKWIEDIKSHAKVSSFSYPIIADEKRELAVKLGMVDPEEKDAAGMPLTCRAVFVIGKDKRVKLSFLNPASTGRNFEYTLQDVPIPAFLKTTFGSCKWSFTRFPTVKCWSLSLSTAEERLKKLVNH